MEFDALFSFDITKAMPMSHSSISEYLSICGNRGQVMSLSQIVSFRKGAARGSHGCLQARMLIVHYRTVIEYDDPRFHELIHRMGKAEHLIKGARAVILLDIFKVDAFAPFFTLSIFH